VCGFASHHGSLSTALELLTVINFFVVSGLGLQIGLEKANIFPRPNSHFKRCPLQLAVLSNIWAFGPLN